MAPNGSFDWNGSDVTETLLCHQIVIQWKLLFQLLQFSPDNQHHHGISAKYILHTGQPSYFLQVPKVWFNRRSFNGWNAVSSISFHYLWSSLDHKYIWYWFRLKPCCLSLYSICWSTLSINLFCPFVSCFIFSISFIMDEHSLSSFNYLGEDMLLQQFSILAENIQKALPPGNESSQAIAEQVYVLFLYQNIIDLRQLSCKAFLNI